MKLGKNAGFISFRFAGTDGVSLETIKWADVLGKMGFTDYYLAGELETPKERSYCYPQLHFLDPQMQDLHNKCFSMPVRSDALSAKLHHFRKKFKEEIYSFINKFDIGLLIPQNSLTIPMNIPLAMALTEVIVETGILTLAHHHDFFWERKRFLRNCVWDIFNACYPPHLPNIEHAVINSSARNQLALRTGIASTLIPNVMPFEQEAPQPDDYSKDIREALGVEKDEYLILQPTRVVQRKGIEHALELIKRLDEKAVLVISHASGDEGNDYEQRLKDYAKLIGVRAIFVDSIIGDKRGTTEDGRKIYTLEDLYPYADFITYPSLVEGFGNAFLEALWFKKPILVNNYTIYATDIKPLGFQVVEMDEYVTNEVVDQVRTILTNPKMAHEMVEKNYQIGKHHYSYTVLEHKLRFILAQHYGYRSIC